MRPPYWKEHSKKVTWKIQQDYYPIVQQSWNDTEYCLQINELIKTGSTGSLEEMARKLKMSIKRAMRLLIFMIDALGCPIEYDAVRKTYFYNGYGNLHIGLVRNGGRNITK